jgi:hypothetical protein
MLTIDCFAFSYTHTHTHTHTHTQVALLKEERTATAAKHAAAIQEVQYIDYGLLLFELQKKKKKNQVYIHPLIRFFLPSPLSLISLQPSPSSLIFFLRSSMSSNSHQSLQHYGILIKDLTALQKRSGIKCCQDKTQIRSQCFS